MMDLSKLHEEFPKSAVHWRVQGKPFARNGNHSAMALAYIDARDVMDRLDSVCGPDRWQSRYIETAKGRVLCEIGIKVGDEWVWKSDGAGDTAVEGEKGGISDSLKRAAVQWGIGRYLYRLDSPWVACEVNDKGAWKRWKEDPWTKVKSGHYTPPVLPKEDDASDTEVDTAIEAINACADLPELVTYWKNLNAKAKHVASEARVIEAKDARKSELEHKEAA